MLKSFSAQAPPPTPSQKHMISTVIPYFFLFFFLNKINGIMPGSLINNAKTHVFPAEVIFHNTWSQNLSEINHVCFFGMSWGQGIQNLKASSVTVHLLLQKWLFFFICSHPTVSSSPLAALSGGRWLQGKSCCSKSGACILSNQLMFHFEPVKNIFPCLLHVIFNCNYSPNDLVAKNVSLSGIGSNSRLVTGSPLVGGAQFSFGAAISLFLSALSELSTSATAE